MPNENKEWEEDFDKKWFHFADKSVSTTLNQHRWSMKDVVRGYIAEATRRGKVEGLEEAKEICKQQIDIHEKMEGAMKAEPLKNRLIGMNIIEEEINSRIASLEAE